MSGVTRNNQDVDIDLIQLFRAIWERKGRVLLVTVAAAGLAFVGASALDKQFKSETRILIEPRALAVDSGAGGGQGASPPDELAVASQVQILQSTDLIKQVARDLKLYDMDEFGSDNSLVAKLMVAARLKDDTSALAPEDRTLKTFREKLAVYQAPGSRVIGIEFTSRDPQVAAAVANRMADVYLSWQSGAKLDTNSETARWLEPEIASLRGKVQEAEQKIATYRANTGLLPTSDTNTLANQQLNDISAELTRVRGERTTAEARAENVRSGLAAGRDAQTMGDIIGSPVIQRLKEQEAQIQSQLFDLRTSLLENHPRLKGLRGQLAGVQEQIRTETRRVLASLDSEANVMRLRERQLTQQFTALKSESAKAGENEVGLKALEREAAAQRQLLETYLVRYREASSRMDPNAQPADARIVSRAIEPREAAFPKVVPIALVVAIAAFLLTSIIIMLAELFSGRALRPVGGADEEALVPDVAPDAEREDAQFAVPAAAAVPSALERRAAQPAGNGEDAFAQADFSVPGVARMIAEEGVSGLPVVVISPDGDEGSALAVLLARRLAGQGAEVLLMDASGSGASTRIMLRRGDLPGISDLLTRSAAFGDIIHSDGKSTAHVVPQGASGMDEAAGAIERLPMILSALTEAYEHVIVDCGAVSARDLSGLLRGREVRLVISLPDCDEERFEEAATEFDAAGFDDFILMTGAQPVETAPAGRRRAA